MGCIELILYNDKAEIKYISRALPGTINVGTKITNYPSEVNYSTIIILAYNMAWPGEWHWNRPDIVILTKADGIYAVCTSADVLNKECNIIYTKHE